MSETEPVEVYPSSRLPALPPEVQLAREEDPEFAEILGRARAKARRVEYRPEIHYPHRPGGTTRHGLPFDELDRIEARLEEWKSRGAFNPYMRGFRR